MFKDRLRSGQQFKIYGTRCKLEDLYHNGTDGIWGRVSDVTVGFTKFFSGRLFHQDCLCPLQQFPQFLPYLLMCVLYPALNLAYILFKSFYCLVSLWKHLHYRISSQHTGLYVKSQSGESQVISILRTDVMISSWWLTLRTG